MGYTLAQLKALIEGHCQAEDHERIVSMNAVRAAVWADKDDYDKITRVQRPLPPIDFEKAEAIAAAAFAEDQTDGIAS